MSTLIRLQHLFEHEKDANVKMLDMIETVPADRRDDPRFQQAVVLAGHLAACRENFLLFMTGGSDRNLVPWRDETTKLESLRPRFAALAAAWTGHLAFLDDDTLAGMFYETWNDGEGRIALPREIQLFQLVTHAPYHRGQIALLVDQLGGETVDTDYVFWAIPESA